MNALIITNGNTGNTGNDGADGGGSFCLLCVDCFEMKLMFMLLVTKVQPNVHRSGSQVPCVGSILVRC